MNAECNRSLIVLPHASTRPTLKFMAQIVVLYNQPLLPPDHPETDSENEVLFTVEHVCNVLQRHGHRAIQLEVGKNPVVLIEQMQRLAPDAVFNLFEGLPYFENEDHGDTETCVAGLIDWLGISYTGSPARVLALARDKSLAKLLLRGAGLPTPDFTTVFSPDDPDLAGDEPPAPLRWPVIVKVADQDASVGIDQGSVVEQMSALRDRIAHLRERYTGRILVEEYIPGRELTMGILDIPMLGGIRTLPASEFEFERTEGGWPIVTYDAKWKVDSKDYEQTPYREVATISPDLTRTLSELSRRSYEALGLRDYGRVDFRVTAEGKPYILEVNPNPDLSPTAGLAGVLDAAGLTYSNLIMGLVEQALARGRREPYKARNEELS